jgi:hypothetical protein
LERLQCVHVFREEAGNEKVVRSVGGKREGSVFRARQDRCRTIGGSRNAPPWRATNDRALRRLFVFEYVYHLYPCNKLWRALPLA